MKARRQARLLELIRQRPIDTQAELVRALAEEGFVVTQATISRDIRELRLVKVADARGELRYLPSEPTPAAGADQLHRLVRQAVVSAEASLNLIVLRTLPALAPPVASSIDLSGWSDVLGTVAGDDTVLVVVRDPSRTGSVLETIRAMLPRG